MNLPNSLTVKYRDIPVGTLSVAPGSNVCTFRYEKSWLADGFSISPLELPLQPQLFVAKEAPLNGGFGIFEDSLPDGYGRYLLHKILKRKGIDSLHLNAVEFLSIIGSAGMGALTYHPHTGIDEKIGMPDLDTMQNMALDVLGEKADGDEDVLYYNSGNSGGCRPKCLYTDSEGHWLVKFRHTYDPEGMGAMEYRYNLAARECGIITPDFKLIENRYFASRRFDIDDSGERLHTATAAALMAESINPPTADYRNLLSLTGFITQDPNQVEQMFRRMVFNILAVNKDDHAKNFTYIYNGSRWILGPAYDLTYCPEGYNGEHATSVNYNGHPTEADMVAVAKNIRIPESTAKAIIEEMRPVCQNLLSDFR